MKEAAGEANMTVITIVLIGIVSAVGAVLIPRLMNNLNGRSCCTEAGGTASNNTCIGGTYSGKTFSTIANISACKAS